MRGISLWQPWTSLLFEPMYAGGPMVKRFETRSWSCPSSIIESGERVAFASTIKFPHNAFDWEYAGDDCVGFDLSDTVSILRSVTRPAHDEPHMYVNGVRRELPRGALLGTGRVAASDLYRTRRRPESDL